MYKIMAGITRRGIAPAGRRVAANGGQNRKATTYNLFRVLRAVAT
jgi:hypothetical protein